METLKERIDGWLSTSKHETGRHDQKTHGNRGGATAIQKNTAPISELKSLIKNPQQLINKIVDIVGEDFDGAIGLRGLYREEKIGKLRQSSEWVDGKKMSRKLSGTSTIGLSPDWQYDPASVIRQRISRYAEDALNYGERKRVALVVGRIGETGEDMGEIIIPGAKAIFIWE